MLKKDGTSSFVSHCTKLSAMWVDVASELTSSNKTLAAFPFVFIVRMYNNLSERFMVEMGLCVALSCETESTCALWKCEARSECKAN